MNDRNRSGPTLQEGDEKFNFDLPPCPLYGATVADMLKHGVVRAEFLNALYADERVRTSLQQWGAETGLMPVAQQIAATINDLERQARPGEVLSTRTLRRLLKPFFTRMGQIDCVVVDVMKFVRDDLNLPWSWVAVELYQMLLLDAWATILGEPYHCTWHVELEDPPAADLRFTFEVQPEETISAAHQRFVDEANTFLTCLQEAAPRVEVGRVPSDLAHEALDGVGKYARWFYRYRVCQETIRSIAIDYHETQGHPRDFAICDCRKAVKYGLAQAERLLTLSE